MKFNRWMLNKLTGENHSLEKFEKNEKSAGTVSVSVRDNIEIAPSGAFFIDYK